MKSIILHYQEIALKGNNRPWFVSRLARNLRLATKDVGVREVRVLMGRIELMLQDGADWTSVRDRITNVFGVANFAIAGRAPLDVDAIAREILNDVGDLNPASFRVSARRADKRFALSSPEIEREVGGRIAEARQWKVDLSRPALTIHVEALTEDAFYYFGKEPGAGGLPAGTSGRVACLLSGGIDSPVAAWRMMRRGCRVLFVHFHSYPILSRASQEKVRELVKLLTRFQYDSKLFLVPFGEIQQQVLLTVPPPLRVVIYRRLMMRIAEAIARKNRAQALVSGEVVGQVASQTLENMIADRPGGVDADASAAGRHGQGRDHRGGAAAGDVPDLDHSRPGLLHAVRAATPGDQGQAARRRRRRVESRHRRYREPRPPPCSKTTPGNAGTEAAVLLARGRRPSL